MTLLSFIFSPLGKFISAVLAILAVLAIVYGKGQLDGRKNIKDNIRVESTKAVKATGDARATAVRRFDSGGLRNDGYRRD
jgi:hypothetical protein